MNHPRFTTINISFTCTNCKVEVPAHKSGSCRNHCNQCLCSLHVDVFPGDRANECKGLLRPVYVDQKGGEFQIYHMCDKCGSVVLNKAAPDDDVDTMCSVNSSVNARPDIVEYYKKNKPYSR